MESQRKGLKKEYNWIKKQFKYRTENFAASKFEEKYMDLLDKYAIEYEKIEEENKLYREKFKELKELSETANNKNITVYNPVCQTKYGRTHGMGITNSPSGKKDEENVYKNTMEEAYIHLKRFAEINYKKIKDASPNKKVKLKKYTLFYKKRDYTKPFSFNSKWYDCLFIITSNRKPLQKFTILKETFEPGENQNFEEWAKKFREIHNL